MAYVPNNPHLYNHVIAGGLGAVAARWNKDAVAADYTANVDACAALAQAVDTLIAPDLEGLDDDDFDLVGRIVGGVVQDRYISSADPLFYADIAAAIVAMWEQGTTALI
jgi:hypothetical protein